MEWVVNGHAQRCFIAPRAVTEARARVMAGDIRLQLQAFQESLELPWVDALSQDPRSPSE